MIDWTKPIEHVDGTPLVLSDQGPNPDISGDYFAVREDGKALTYEQAHPYGEYDVIYCSRLMVRPNGDAWGFAGSHPVQIVRNRAVKQETVTIADLPTAPDREELYARINAQQAQIDDLHADVAELEAWKADAIAQHPDLAPVDPILLKARKIVGRHLHNNGLTSDAQDVLWGHSDDHMAVCAVLDALRTAQEA